MWDLWFLVGRVRDHLVGVVEFPTAVLSLAAKAGGTGRDGADDRCLGRIPEAGIRVVFSTIMRTVMCRLSLTWFRLSRDTHIFRCGGALFLCKRAEVTVRSIAFACIFRYVSAQS